MDSPTQHDVTRLLLQWKGGDQAALEALMPMVESELRRLAGGYMRNERPGHTLQPTALVNEAWLRLAQQDQPQYESRSHFVAIAAHAMRRILVETREGRMPANAARASTPLPWTMPGSSRPSGRES